MEREILFRGFAPSENGTQEIWIDGTCTGEAIKGKIKGEWVEGEVQTIWGKKYIYNCQFSPPLIPDIPETVGQWTGLTDKNGKKIFEHDKLKDSKGQVGTIFYSETAAAFLVNWKMKDGTFETDACFYGEVIGTIFDKEEV